MSEVYVIGHRNPDTDAICSAIGYAEFKRRTGLPEAVAARCGDTNDRIDFVLNTFGAAAPLFVSDVSPKVKDVMRTNVMSVTPDTTVAEAMSMMDERNIRVLPVLRTDGVCEGLLSLFKISRFFFPAARRLTDSRRLLTSLDGLARTLGGKLLHGSGPDEEEELTLVVGAMSVESFGVRTGRLQSEKLAVVVGDRWDVQNLAIREKVRVVIVTGGLEMEPRTLESAIDNNVAVILSPHDTATTANLSRAAMSVKHVLHEHFLTFQPEENLGSVRALASGSNFHAFPVVDADGKTVGIFSKSDLLKEVDRKLILVDHNELSQAVRGADKVEILEIIDHHRIGSLTTSQPILFRNEPVGSTSTIVADSFIRYGIEMPKNIAGLLLAGLVSDTLNLTSPTTTARDAEILGKLEQVSGVNATTFTEKLFASGSLLISRPPEQAITSDCKEYEESARKFSIAQIEEIGFDQFWKRKEDLLLALENYRNGRGYFFSALLVTDVVLQVSLLLLVGDETLGRLIDYPIQEEGIFELQGVVSRKKQLLPYLTHCLRQIPG
mgnify:CR=1 FL=1